MTKNTYLS